MWWECSECGCRVRGQHRPVSCPVCGIASAIFKTTEKDDEWEPGGGGLRDYWLTLGMNDLQGPSLDPTPLGYT